MLLLKLFCLTASALQASAKRNTPPEPSLRPSHESARQNAFLIFNAIHATGRQWGSSLHHNGFGFIPTLVPAGTLLYHGAGNSTIPPDFEWLSFEIEHAEFFASSQDVFPEDRDTATKNKIGPKVQPFVDQYRLNADPQARPTKDRDPQSPGGGYLQTYQATRDLNLLLLDGTSAAKSPSLGTLDSQDLVLRENKTNSGDDVLDEVGRMSDICGILKQVHFDGIIRMEAGFEIVYCDFSDGLELAESTLLQPFKSRLATEPDSFYFQWFRAAAQRYDDIGGGRLQMDFSSMASGLFFPINISSPTPERPHLIRLGAANHDELKNIKSYVLSIMSDRRKFNVNWQHIVDMIVSRFSDRLAFLTSDDIPLDMFIKEIEAATLTYYDALHVKQQSGGQSELQTPRNRTEEAIQRCKRLPLRPSLLSKNNWSPEDSLIYTAIEAVALETCNTLFTVREFLRHSINTSIDDQLLSSAKHIGQTLAHDLLSVSQDKIRNLTFKLDWTTWKRTRRCPTNALEFVAMYPFGNQEDHWNPGCRSLEDIKRYRAGYWPPPWE